MTHFEEKTPIMPELTEKAAAAMRFEDRYFDTQVLEQEMSIHNLPFHEVEDGVYFRVFLKETALIVAQEMSAKGVIEPNRFDPFYVIKL